MHFENRISTRISRLLIESYQRFHRIPCVWVAICCCFSWFHLTKFQVDSIPSSLSYQRNAIQTLKWDATTTYNCRWRWSFCKIQHKHIFFYRIFTFCAHFDLFTVEKNDQKWRERKIKTKTDSNCHLLAVKFAISFIVGIQNAKFKLGYCKIVVCAVAL